MPIEILSTCLKEPKGGSAGARYGRMVILRVLGRTIGQAPVVEAQCDCGSIKPIRLMDLRTGATTSCGCRNKEVIASRNYRHGLSKSKSYVIWTQMIQRCENPTNRAYAKYGGRGIRVCERWRTFSNFFADMGEKPEGLSLDRIDNNEGYSPENCRWATTAQQTRNTRQNVWLLVDGIEMVQSDAARLLGCSIGNIAKRIKKAKNHGQSTFILMDRKFEILSPNS